MSNTGHKNISRYKGKKKGSGLQVCVQWKKELRYQSFPDINFDSPAETLLSALDWRNETEIELGKPRTERRILSGSGVYRSKDFYGNENWVAQCSPALGKMMRKYFSIKKYGEDFARILAIRKRRMMEQEYYGGIFYDAQIPRALAGE